MNKQITIYELLGLIKNGKAPKKIKYDDIEYKYGNGYYYRVENEIPKIFTNDYSIFLCLNDQVEILEENKPIIEKIDMTTENTLFTMECFTGIPEKAQDWNFNILKNTLNQVIDYINKKEKDN